MGMALPRLRVETEWFIVGRAGSALSDQSSTYRSEEWAFRDYRNRKGASLYRRRSLTLRPRNFRLVEAKDWDVAESDFLDRRGWRDPWRDETEAS
jgi:hypothetical protein